MLRVAQLLFFTSVLLAGAAASRADLPLFQPGPGGAPLPPNRDVCWSEPPDLEGYLLSSEVIGEYGLESEIANDFVFEEDRTIRKIRWWGGYYGNDVPCEPGMVAAGFHVRLYRSDGCMTDPPYYGVPLAEWEVEGSAGETFVGCSQDGFPLYRYESLIDLDATGGTPYWLGIQMADHAYPPQWGRLLTPTITGCESLFWTNAYFDWMWYPLSELIFFPLDASQEFECETPVPTQHTTWGKVRALYR